MISTTNDIYNKLLPVLTNIVDYYLLLHDVEEACSDYKVATRDDFVASLNSMTLNQSLPTWISKTSHEFDLFKNDTSSAACGLIDFISKKEKDYKLIRIKKNKLEQNYWNLKKTLSKYSF